MVQGRMNTVMLDLGNCVGKIFELRFFFFLSPKLIISFGCSQTFGFRKYSDSALCGKGMYIVLAFLVFV